MLGHFERLLPPYPDPEPELPPKGFLAFVWRATTGLRGYIGLMALLSAGTSIYDALLFALLGEIERDGFHVLHQRIALTPLRKLWLAWKMQALGRF